jgi:hypothetical protein
MSLTLWQHSETGRLVWLDETVVPGYGWSPIPIMYEDELPDMTNDEYGKWFADSAIVDGVRMGYRI